MLVPTTKSGVNYPIFQVDAYPSAERLSVVVRADAALLEAAHGGGSAEEEVVRQLRTEHVVQHAKRARRLQDLRADKTPSVLQLYSCYS